MISNASHIGFTIMNVSRMILHYQIQLCNAFNQFKKIEITILVYYLFFELLKDKIKINSLVGPFSTKI